MAISSAIVAILKDNANVLSTFGQRMYPDIIPKNAILPALSYTVNNIQITETKTGTTGWDEIDVTITIYHINRTSCETYAGYVRTAFNRAIGTYGGETILTTNHRGESWDFVDDFTQPGESSMGHGVFAQVLNFRIVSK